MNTYITSYMTMDDVSWSSDFVASLPQEVGLTQKQETKTLQNLTTLHLSYFIV